MHLLTEQTTTIACPVEAAYQYATNMERFGEWFPGVISIVSANTLQHAQRGKEYLETVAVPLRGKRQIKLSVKEAQADKLFVTEGEFPPLMPRMEIVFQATGADSCEIRWRIFSRNESLLIRATLIPLARSVMRNRAAIGMKQLTQTLESRHANSKVSTMKLSVERQPCCAADDQIGPLEMSFDLPESATLKGLAEKISESRFLQFSSTHHTIYGESAGQALLSISSAFPGKVNITFFVAPEQLVSIAVPDGQLVFRFRSN